MGAFTLALCADDFGRGLRLRAALTGRSLLHACRAELPAAIENH
jgi:hypothetical protein